MAKGKFRKAKRNVAGIVGTSVGLGVGASVVGGLGGNTAGLTSFGRFLPVAGTLGGASLALESVKGLTQKKKRRSRR